MLQESHLVPLQALRFSRESLTVVWAVGILLSRKCSVQPLGWKEVKTFLGTKEVNPLTKLLAMMEYQSSSPVG
jgi:hypothetical protein